MLLLKIDPSYEGRGVVEPDEFGYYNIVVGAMNTTNRSGMFYEATPTFLSQISSPTSFINKRIKDKSLYGEIEHPAMSVECQAILKDPASSEEMRKAVKIKWLKRQLSFDLEHRSHHIKSLSLKEIDDVDKTTGKKVILIIANLKPIGKYAQDMIDAFADPDRGVHFSMRAGGTAAVVADGRRTARVTTLFTFDHVELGGITYANDQQTLRYVEEDEYAELLTYDAETLHEAEVLQTGPSCFNFAKQELWSGW